MMWLPGLLASCTTHVAKASEPALRSTLARATMLSPTTAGRMKLEVIDTGGDIFCGSAS